MRQLAILLLLVAGCGRSSNTSFSFVEAQSFLIKLPANEVAAARTTVVCGPSSGKELFAGDQESWQTDGIKEGRLAFLDDGKVSTQWFVGATGVLVSAVKDGGVIDRTSSSASSPYGTWIIKYPQTGVVEAHNLSPRSNGALLDLWTSNKPAVGNLPSRMFAFTSRCFKL